MESYYSSDEEIAWGPVSLREIKGDLKRPWLKPKRRHTVSCNFQMEDSKDGGSLCEERTSDNLNVSLTSTEYYTPNESIPKSENLNNANGVNDTCLNFVKTVQERETRYDIANFQQTLVENSFMSEDEKELETGFKQYFDKDSFCDDVKGGPLKKSVDYVKSLYADRENKLIEKEINQDVVLISDDEESYVMSGDDSLDDSILNSSVSVGRDTDEPSESSGEIDHEENVYSKDHLYKNTSIPIQGESTNYEFSKERPTGEIKQSTEITRVLPIIEKKSVSTLPASISEKNLTHFNASSSTNDSLQLDDTLEEMNRLLHQGLNYTMSDEEPITGTPPKKEPTGLQFASSSIISGSFSQKQPEHFFSTIEKIANTPSKIPTLEKYPTNQYSLKSTPDNFKIPSVLPRMKLTNPSTPKSYPNHLKNIVSPVALYIKNSPNMILNHNTPQKKVSRVVALKGGKQNRAKENLPAMPEVVYTPSKKQIVSREKEIVLPPSLKRLNVKEPVVTKHEGRLHQNLNTTRVNTMLLENVTDCSINTSMLDNSRNMSVLTKRQAFIK